MNTLTTNPTTPMTLLDVFVAPKTVFEQLQSAKKWSWLALVLLISVTSASLLAFFSNMTPEWIVEQQLMQMGDVSASERAAATEALELTAEYTGVIGAVFTVIAQVIMISILAGFYLAIGKFAAKQSPQYSYGDWFSFAIWTQMPALINMIGFTILFTTAAVSDLPLTLTNYASLNQLVLNLAPTEALYTWAESINIFSVWSIIIAMIGLQHCCKMTTVKAFTFATLPYITVFGSWFILA
ncbi:YIP1 family protein [Psychrobium sp. 1_MG-2023]|uniref:YIP1 family protein n=1 Tax=Psychrobium sp. 1_MG-2023 TaxID=3062624 RepID=UPI000C32815D|nr:YIP1 family protein [Psychrobium sp. 1_MG-2023]MDP2560497.1 YIP1 family protein [Psychrobium sp. 1_MG-2023]PKF55194.1 hypothetical protein CW748_13975 [Alteromonadales bacterium alter-6D02]